MLALIERIAAYIDRWHNPYLLQIIFGSADPEFIAERFNAFCLSELGSPLAETVFFEASQGLVFGLQLRDGRRDRRSCAPHESCCRDRRGRAGRWSHRLEHQALPLLCVIFPKKW
jgi:hypothetical protein